MKRPNEQIILIVSLLATSLALYLLHLAIFRDVYNIFFYGLMDIAFIPISVLLVSLIINRVLTERERQSLLTKLDMVIGVFFSDVGTRLLSVFGAFDGNYGQYRQRLVISGRWTEKDFREVTGQLSDLEYSVDSQSGDLAALRVFMREKRGFLLRLLENPNLLAHEAFTELLLAVTHVAEELDYRDDLSNLPAADYAHLSGDIKRAYRLLIREWLSYMAHLKVNYPYLYSLAIRVNPFDPDASPVVR
jgi:hypothetical protein